MTMTTENPHTDSDEYNGWPNRETWAASLHLSNDYGLYEMVNGWANQSREAAEHFRRNQNPKTLERYGWSIEAATITQLADMLKGYIGDLHSDIQNGEQTDETERMMVLEIGSVWRVDWRQLAENWLEGFEFEGEES